MHDDPHTHLAIVCSVSDGIATLAIDRPDKRNALSQDMWRAITSVVSAWTIDSHVRAILFTGAGPHFSAGADIGEFEAVYADREHGAAYAALLARAMDTVAGCPKPTVAAIRGTCIGAGLGLALCCDLRLASSDARFAITPANLGLAYSFEDTRRLVDLAGPTVARDLLLSARIVDSTEAFRMRLVDRVLDPQQMTAEVDATLRRLASRSATSAAIAKRFIALALAGQTHDSEATRSAYLDAIEGPDFAEGRDAFTSGRTPRF